MPLDVLGLERALYFETKCFYSKLYEVRIYEVRSCSTNLIFQLDGQNVLFRIQILLCLG